MPTRRIAGTDFDYELLVFGQDGKERPEPDGTLLSDTVTHAITTGGVTDVFFTSHGWKGDMPAAIAQYDAWVGTMLALAADRDAVARQRARFKPLVVGLHWPSLPWGDETIPINVAKTLAAAPSMLIENLVDDYASRVVDTPKARAALRTIFEASRGVPNTTTLSPLVREAYATLFAESGLASGDVSGRPGADQDGFDPEAIISAARLQAGTAGTAHLLGLGQVLINAIETPLRQLSFWKMKDRARAFGESGGHDLLIRLQKAAPGARFHLMGHSFGCIVVSATVAGPLGGERLPRPVESMFLVQGALSLWAFAADIPCAPSTAGYFHRIVRDGLVQGPLVTTRSKQDTAVGRFYPLGAQLKKQFMLDVNFPMYGGIGSFGIQGVAGAVDMPMQPATFAYGFEAKRIYNLEASNIIRNSSGLAGAHNDIAHPEVAHAFWCAVLARAPSALVPMSQRPAQVVIGHVIAGGDIVGGDKIGDVKIGGVKIGGDLNYLGGLLSAELAREALPATFSLPAAPSPVTAQRWINASIEDQAPDVPLLANRWYTLSFDIDVAQHPNAVGAAAFITPELEKQIFPEDIDEVVLTVQLDSNDFEFSTPTRLLRLPRLGRSNTKARFDLSPRHDGPCIATATIHKDGNFIQEMKLTFTVGAARPTQTRLTSRGRPPSAVALVRPRDVGISISPVAGGYDVVVWGAVSSRARLPLQPGYLTTVVDEARGAFTKVVMQQDATGNYVFQSGLDIPKDQQDIALTTMARAGARLFQNLFFGPAAAADSNTCGEFLRSMANNATTTLKLQIVAERMPVPWGLLYIGDASAGAQLDWNNFIGMRHLIEQIPLRNTPSFFDCAIPSNQPELAVSVNVNSAIDAQMTNDFVARQQTFWDGAAASREYLRVTQRTTAAEVVQALANGVTNDQILYFYCHAESAGLKDPGGPDASCLVLSDARIQLGDLYLDAPIRIQLSGAPLVFINACESAELSPAFYDGFVPYFMAKGARGVIGTECQTPALFAVEWAKAFFTRFLNGQPLGEIFLELRQEFLKQHGNPLGLLYAMHCDGDTCIEPALTTAIPAVPTTACGQPTRESIQGPPPSGTAPDC